MKIARAAFFAGLLSFICISLPAQDVTFSMPHGMYSEGFEVVMTQPKLTAKIIRYTTDGRIPCPSDPEYTAPIRIDKTTVLRAAAMSRNATVDNYTTPLTDVTTCTYLFPVSIMNQPDNPSGYPSTWGPFCEISGTAPADYGMDQELLNNKTFGQKANQGLFQLPWLSIVTDPDNLFSHEKNEKTGGIYIYTGAPVGNGYGEGWERPVSFELFDSEGRFDIQANCGIRLHGGHSSIPEKNPKHSFRVAFRSEYGQSKLKAQLFGPGSPTKYNSLVIRTFGNNSWQHWRESNRQRAQCTRDMWARETQRKMGHEYIRGNYVHLFLNGLYWGVYNLSERPDDDYCSTNFGGSSDDYDVYKDNALDCGNSTLWNSMKSKTDSIKSLCKNGDQKTSHKVLQRLGSVLDIDNFIDYMVLSLYAANTDWDAHNWVAIANRKAGTGFRFLCWDSELVLGDLYEDVTSKYDGQPSKMLTKLMNDDVFRHRFADHVQKLCYNDGALTPDSVKATWDEVYHLIDRAIYDESARWGDYRRDVHSYEATKNIYTPDNFFATERKRLMDEYFPARTGILISQLRSCGWLVDIDAPRILVDGTDIHKWVKQNGDTIFADHKLTLKAASMLYLTYYSIDGQTPVSWESSSAGSKTKSCNLYSSTSEITDLFKDSDEEFITFTLKAVSKYNSDWSPIVERKIVIQNPALAGVSTITRKKVSIDGGIVLIDGKAAQTVVSISGAVVPNSDLKPGMYIADGIKVVVK